MWYPDYSHATELSQSTTFGYTRMTDSDDGESIEDYPLRPKPEQGEKLRKILHKRSDLLQAVVDEPAGKPELVDTVGVSRSTVNRGIRSLESVDCVESKNGQYTATKKGELALAEYRKYEAQTDTIDDSGDVLNFLPKDATISDDFLRNITVSSRDPNVPDAVLESSYDLLESTSRMIGLAPIALTTYPDLIKDGIENRSLSVELVIEDTVFDSLWNVNEDLISKLNGDDNVTLYISEDSLPYSLWVMEHEAGVTAGITVHGDGAVQGILTNDSPAAVEWAREMYNDYREQAIPVGNLI